jgi:hypothetical protein
VRGAPACSEHAPLLRERGTAQQVLHDDAHKAELLVPARPALVVPERHLQTCVQPTTCNMQRATCKRATCNVQHATCNMQRATCNVQHATCNMQTCNMQRATCNAASSCCCVRDAAACCAVLQQFPRDPLRLSQTVTKCAIACMRSAAVTCPTLRASVGVRVIGCVRLRARAWACVDICARVCAGA